MPRSSLRYDESSSVARVAAYNGAIHRCMILSCHHVQGVWGRATPPARSARGSARSHAPHCADHENDCDASPKHCAGYENDWARSGSEEMHSNAQFGRGCSTMRVGRQPFEADFHPMQMNLEGTNSASYLYAPGCLLGRLPESLALDLGNMSMVSICLEWWRERHGLLRRILHRDLCILMIPCEEI